MTALKLLPLVNNTLSDAPPPNSKSVNTLSEHTISLSDEMHVTVYGVHTTIWSKSPPGNADTPFGTVTRIVM